MYIYGEKAMLTKFSVENYKSFNKKVTLDLKNSHDYDFNKEAINNGVIKNALIFGENSSGKSNFSYALFDIVPTLTNKNSHLQQMDVNSFLNFDSDKNYATFCYEFILDNKKVKYEYRKEKPTVIVYEELIVDDEIIFTCDTKNKSFINFSFNLLGYNSFNYEEYNWDIAFLRFFLTNTSHNDDSIVKFIFEFASKMLWFRSLNDNSYIGIRTGSEVVTEWIIENNLVHDFETFFNSLNGQKLRFDVAITNNPMPRKTLVVVNKTGEKGLNFDNVNSAGSKSLLILYYWFKQMQNVSFVFIDEFDAFYHFALSKKVLELFKNQKNVQTLFSSHNTYLATNEILRPDCFFTLANGEIKSFIDRTQRELREGHNLEKLLRSGEFDE